MTRLALNAAFKTSAVSKSHAQFAKIAWPEYPLVPITNGVYRDFWQKPEWSDINFQISRGLEIASEEIWETHSRFKNQLIHEVNKNSGKSLNHKFLTITWARRMAAYKQPLLLFSNIEKLVSFCKHKTRPVQFIITGKAHPADTGAKAVILEIQNIINRFELQNKIVFLPNYNLKLAQMLVAGSDVWLNTPVKGQEACGTSGMKAGLNGVLQCGISDGWTDEIDLHELGFPIDPTNSAENIYIVLEQIIQMYYDLTTNEEENSEWIKKLKMTVSEVGNNYTARRMMLQYIQELYLPVLNNTNPINH